MTIIYKDCDPELAKNKELPRNSYIISYENNGALHYDIVQSSSQVEVFDKYWDEYKNVKAIEWTTGLVDPKSYGYVPKETKKKR